MKTPAMTNGVHVVYSPINQAYFVMWYSEILRICNDKASATEYVSFLVGA